jgi:hypothetical protein
MYKNIHLPTMGVTIAIVIAAIIVWKLVMKK